jgi:hypothetical protein
VGEQVVESNRSEALLKTAPPLIKAVRLLTGVIEPRRRRRGT